MAYSEQMDKNGLFTRKYYGLDSSGIFKMYYNTKAVKFPVKKLLMGKENQVTISIDMKKFIKNFILKKAYVRLKVSNSNLRNDLHVYRSKNISSIEKILVGKMIKEKRGYFIYDFTKILQHQINTRLNLTITTSSRVDLYTLFAFYDSKAELVIEYYDDSYQGEQIFNFKSGKNFFHINNSTGIGVLERDLIKNGLIDLKLIINNHNNYKCMFNYEGFIYGGIDNYKYIDSQGIKHYFKLSGVDSFKTHVDIFDTSLTLESGPQYLIKKNDECLIFDEKGFLVEVQRKNGNVFIKYENCNISTIEDSNGNFLKFKYENNKIIITDSKDKSIKIKFIKNYIQINSVKYHFNKNNKLSKVGNINFCYDSINRIKILKGRRGINDY